MLPPISCPTVGIGGRGRANAVIDDYCCRSAVDGLRDRGGYAEGDESSDYQASTDRYLACILTNSNDPQQCEVARVLMEADGRRYNNTLPGTVPGR